MARMNITNAKSGESVQNSTTTVNSSAVQLNDLVIQAYTAKKAKEEYDAKLKATFAMIIDYMKPLGIKELKTNGIKCTISERTNTSCNEAGLLEYCKTLEIPGLVKTVEVVDLDVLGDLVYNLKIDPAEIEQFYSKSITESVRISGKLID